MQRKKRETTALSLKLKNIQPQAVQLHQDQLIRRAFLDDQNPLPLIIRPQVPELVISQWAQKNLSFLEAELGKYGALLLRDFHIPTPAEFERFASILCPD